MHDLLHVALLVTFLSSLAGAFLLIVFPLIFETPRKTSLRLPMLLGAGAIVAFSVDWMIHRS